MVQISKKLKSLKKNLFSKELKWVYFFTKEQWDYHKNFTIRQKRTWNTWKKCEKIVRKLEKMAKKTWKSLHNSI